MKKLNFYIVKEEYIKYLSQFDCHVAYNKIEQRPYIGIVLIIEDNYYFAPMFSPKPQHEKYRNNYTMMKMFGKNNKYLGLIRFTDMIPIPKSEVYKLDIKSKGIEYEELLKDQYLFINKNKERVYKKANKLYKLVLNDVKFYTDLSCNFKLLEDKCIEWKKVHSVDMKN